jgi:hypothetical protein
MRRCWTSAWDAKRRNPWRCGSLHGLCAGSDAGRLPRGTIGQQAPAAGPPCRGAHQLSGRAGRTRRRAIGRAHSGSLQPTFPERKRLQARSPSWLCGCEGRVCWKKGGRDASPSRICGAGDVWLVAYTERQSLTHTSAALRSRGRSGDGCRCRGQLRRWVAHDLPHGPLLRLFLDRTPSCRACACPRARWRRALARR